jgi:hypothetical protein
MGYTPSWSYSGGAEHRVRCPDFLTLRQQSENCTALIPSLNLSLTDYIIFGYVVPVVSAAAAIHFLNIQHLLSS